MKLVLIVASAFSAATVSVAASAPAFAQDAPKTGLYGTLDYSHHDVGGAGLNVIDGRLGDRINNWFAVEGEVGFGLNNASVSPGVREKINNQEALYAVGLVPLGSNFDLFGRVGYGRTEFRESGGATVKRDENGWRWGGGARWMFNDANGLRGEFTQEELHDTHQHDNVWSVSYVRKF